MKRIYLDYASLTPIDKRVLKVVEKYSSPEYMNPSSIHSEGVATKRVLDEARVSCAKSLSGSSSGSGAHADEIFFTGSGTEANNLAIQGVVEVAKNIFSKNKSENRAGGSSVGELPHIIVSAIEHTSVLEVAKKLRDEGEVELDILGVNSDGVVDVAELKKLLRAETVLVSIMMVNNEIGTIQPMDEIVKTVRHFRKDRSEVGAASNYPLIHTDACQAFLYEDIYMEKLGVDLLTLDGHKVFGPRGVGMLYVRRSVRDMLGAVVVGGGQERGLRSGTENVPGIVGFAKALEIGVAERESERQRLLEIRDTFAKDLLKASKNVHEAIQINCELAPRSPHILNVTIPGIDSEFFVLQLDALGVACSTKSSCLRDEDESYVLKAIGVYSKNSVRFSFGRTTTKSEITNVLKFIKNILVKGTLK